MAVNEVDPEGVPTCGPPRAFSHWAYDFMSTPREEYLIYHGYIWGVGVGWRGISQVCSYHPMLNLPISFQVPRRQVRVTLRSADLQAESLLVRMFLLEYPTFMFDKMCC